MPVSTSPVSMVLMPVACHTALHQLLEALRQRHSPPSPLPRGRRRLCSAHCAFAVSISRCWRCLVPPVRRITVASGRQFQAAVTNPNQTVASATPLSFNPRPGEGVRLGCRVAIAAHQVATGNRVKPVAVTSLDNSTAGSIQPDSTRWNSVRAIQPGRHRSRNSRKPAKGSGGT